MNLQLRSTSIVGMPKGNILLFLAKAVMGIEPCFCAVFGKIKTNPPNTEGHTELSEANIAIFDESGSCSSLYPVRHGHKYPFGGGMAEIDESGMGVSWTTADECGRNMFFGTRIRPADVLVAL